VVGHSEPPPHFARATFMFRPSFALHHKRRRDRSHSFRPRFEFMEARTLLSAVSWTGTAGDNNWDTAGNWSSSPALPGPSDDVTIDVSADVMHSSNITDSIHSLTSSQPLETFKDMHFQGTSVLPKDTGRSRADNRCSSRPFGRQLRSILQRLHSRQRCRHTSRNRPIR
jgi:hypothetical protein